MFGNQSNVVPLPSSLQKVLGISHARVVRSRRREEDATPGTSNPALITPQFAAIEVLKPRIEKILGAEVVIYFNESRRSTFMSDPERRDHFVSGHGYTEELGFVSITNHATSRYIEENSRGFGINIYKTRSEDDCIKYGIITFPTSYGVQEILVVPKGLTFRLHRQWQRQRANHIEIKKPVLPDGLLEDIEKNTVSFLRSARKFKSYKIKARRGIVLSGPPGNGKTMVCRYIRQLCDQNSIGYNVVSASEIQQAYMHDNLDSLMNYSGILFLDDIDISIFSRRKGEGDDKLACAMLAAMDGMDNDSDCIRIFTTNEVMSSMDSAFKRPGRIDKVFQFEKPNAKMRRALLDTWPEDILESMDIDNATLQTKNLSFAEIDGIKSMMVTSLIIDGSPFDFEEALQEMKETIENKDSGKAVKEATGKQMGFTANADNGDTDEVED